MAETISRNCKNCSKKFRTNKKNIVNPDFLYCSVCRKHHKSCEVCGKEMFAQARTCSKECAYELKKISWQRTCGTEHNFSKKSSSRKDWESRLFIDEGISNVFQRKSVKNKSKETLIKNYGVDHPSKSKEIQQKKVQTCKKNYDVSYGWMLTEKVNKTMLEKYGQLRISNGEKISKYRRKILRPKMEELGLWIPLSELSEYQKYQYNVWNITKQHIKNFGNLINSELLFENINIENWKEKWSIDHKFSIKEGWLRKISPEIIGSIINLEIISFSGNSKKQSKCSITLEKLIKEYNIFINENKIY